MKYPNNIIILSSCRLEALVDGSYIHEMHHTHNTKEVIQYINYINGDINIAQEMHKYVFRSCFLDNGIEVNRDRLKREFDSAGIVCIEICSRKKYKKNNYCIHHLAADRGDSPGNHLVEEDKCNDEFVLEIQDELEIERDILHISSLLRGKKVVFVTHIDCGLKKRKELIFTVSEICRINSILCVKPSDIFDQLASEMTDSNHYSMKGLEIIADFIVQTLSL